MCLLGEFYCIVAVIKLSLSEMNFIILLATQIHHDLIKKKECHCQEWPIGDEFLPSSSL